MGYQIATQIVERSLQFHVNLIECEREINTIIYSGHYSSN